MPTPLTAPVADLDDVLDLFVAETTRPDAAALARFVARFPQHRDALVDLATVWIEELSLPAPDPACASAEATLVDRAVARLEPRLAALHHDARNTRDGLASMRTLVSLSDLAARSGQALMDLAAPLALDAGLMAKLDRRLIRAETLPRRLIGELADRLGSTASVIRDLLSAPPAAPVAAFLVIRSAVTQTVESFTDAVDGSTLTDEAKARWRAERA